MPKGILVLKRYQKFNLALIIQVVLTALFKLLPVKPEILDALLWAVGFGNGVYIFIMIFNYFCPHCRKNQVMKGFLSYSLPSERCWNCNEKIN